MMLFEDDINRLIEIQAYINSNLEKDLKVKTLSQHFNLGKHTLRRQFNGYFDVSIHQYILDKRMLKAYKLLLNKIMPICEVARTVGYSDVSTFSHAFSAYHNIAPNNCLKSNFEDHNL